MYNNESFQLPVHYEGEVLSLPAVLSVSGYAHTFLVTVNEHKIIFEPDEERNYRARVKYDDIGYSNQVDITLLKSIATAITEIVK